MTDYISRESALKAFRLTAKNSNKDYQRGLQDAIDCLVPEVIADIPSAEVQPINPLVKVEERVPTVSGNYLCYLSNGEFEVLYFDREIKDDEHNNNYPFGVWNTYPSDDGGECREWIEVLEVTHWQPLPEPPKDSDANEDQKAQSPCQEEMPLLGEGALVYRGIRYLQRHQRA